MIKAKFKCKSVYANIGFGKAELIPLTETGEEVASAKPLEINTAGNIDSLNFKPGKTYIVDIKEDDEQS